MRIAYKIFEIVVKWFVNKYKIISHKVLLCIEKWKRANKVKVLEC